MKSVFRRIFHRKEDRALLAYGQKNLSSISTSLPEDIFIAGYPKSGNSWFQDLIAGLVFGTLPDKTHPKLVADLVPDVQHEKMYKRYQTPTYFKTHHFPLPQYRKVVYLLRDGRDVMVSYWHHLKALERKEIDFLDLVKSGKGLYPGKWHDHVEAWTANPHGAEIIVIKYEDLLSQPVTELQRLCLFAGIEAETSFIEMICDGTSFKKIQAREQRLGEANDQWPKEKLFRRRGMAGSFRDEMPEEVLQAFLAEAKGTLLKHGYEL